MLSEDNVCGAPPSTSGLAVTLTLFNDGLLPYLGSPS
jgi:hypothetical protein